MIKILMVCEAFGGGVFAYLAELCNDICDQFDVYLAYSVRSQTPKNFKKLLDSRIHLISVKNFGPLSNPFKDLLCIRELKRIAKKVNPDIIHLHSSIAGGFGRIAFNAKKYKIIYTPHGYAHILLGPGKKSKIYECIEKKLGKKDCLTLTCCESEDDIAKTLTKRTFYIETGINISKFDKQFSTIRYEKKNKFTVYTLGRICTQKQPSLFNKIAELVPEADFLWIGDGELRNELVASNIRVTGWKSREEALSIAKGADAFILCSLGEAIAMSLLENMYLGKLTMVSNVMGNKSVIQNCVNGYICERPEDFAQAIKDAIRDFPNKLCENAKRDIIEKYNTNVMKLKFIDLYGKIMNEKD